MDQLKEPFFTPKSKDKKNCPTLKFKMLLKFTIGTLLLLTAIVFTVLSKLTLISMTSRLSYALAVKETSAAVSLYWQLLFVMMAPQCITFLRTMVRGVCGKTTDTFPWPTLLAGLMVSECIINVYVRACKYESI